MITIAARLKACRASLWRRGDTIDLIIIIIKFIIIKSMGDTGHHVSIAYFMSSLLHLYKHTL